MTLREEFRLKNLGFSGVSAERFVTFQWRLAGIIYLIYRLVVAIFTFSMLCYTASRQLEHPINGGQGWGAYLTNWTYTVLTLYFVVHAVVTVVIYISSRNENRRLLEAMDPSEHAGLFHELQSRREDLTASAMVEQQPLLGVMFSRRSTFPWYLKIVWILFNVASGASLIVTLVFWAILVPTMGLGGGNLINHDNIELHLVNSVLILIENFMTAVPVRLLHVVYPFTYGLVYMFFSLFYWMDDHSHVMYDILDWGKPGATVGYICLVGFVLMPLFQLFLYLIYRVRLKIYCCVNSL